MSEPTKRFRFDGRVVIVTGAGGAHPSLGRSHALLLASRGARVVVNDLGVGSDGRRAMAVDADDVVAEIREAGGEAIADKHNVADEEEAKAVVQAALDQWGRVDALVNNAGVAHLARFDRYSAADIRAQVDVHLLGTIWMCRAVWPHMAAAGYGRIVNTASNGVFGGHDVAIYGAAKGGIFSLSNNLAAEGMTLGIQVNTLAPGALTQAIALHLDREFVESMQGRASPDQVSPAVAFLAHEQCPMTGRFIQAAGGMVAEYVFQVTRGFSSPSLTVEDVADHLGDITDRDGMADVPPPQDSPYRPKEYTPG